MSNLEVKEFGGLDLASVRDVSCLVLLAEIDEKLVCLPYFWTPKETAFVRSRRDGVDYVGWKKEGLMELPRIVTGKHSQHHPFDF